MNRPSHSRFSLLLSLSPLLKLGYLFLSTCADKRSSFPIFHFFSLFLAIQTDFYSGLLHTILIFHFLHLFFFLSIFFFLNIRSYTFNKKTVARSRRICKFNEGVIFLVLTCTLKRKEKTRMNSFFFCFF